MTSRPDPAADSTTEHTMDDQYTHDASPVAAARPGPGPASALAAPAHPVQATLARIGLLGIAAAALVAAALLAFGAGASPTGTLAAGTTGSNADGTVELNLGGGRGFAHMLGGIEITAISGSNISLETADGWTRTITVDGDTDYTRGDDDITLADLAVGDEIAFRQTREDDGTWTIDAIAVIPPHAAGEVTAVSGSTITVEGRDGTSVTINVDADTDYTVDGDSATLADVEVGMHLLAQGTESADGTLTATDVKAVDPDSFPGGPGGPGGRGHAGRGFGFGFGFGPGFDGSGDSPDATAAPSATGTTGTAG